MRPLCDVCEAAAAILFCAADEAALCRSCDQKVHLCNKLASRHVRVGLADPSDVSRCDICENAPAFFYCEIDGSSLCLQCDMAVHVGGKRTHERYLLFRQKIEFPGDKAGHLQDLTLQPMDPAECQRERVRQPEQTTRENRENYRVPVLAAKHEDHRKMENNMIDLNTKPNRIRGQASRNRSMNGLNGCYEGTTKMIPTGALEKRQRSDGDTCHSWH